MQYDTLAIDFGTSNTAAALPLEGGAVYRIPIERGADTLPTAVFFPARGGPMRMGVSAAEALLAGEEGRYMRALKSVLGLPLLHESRLIGGKRRTIADVITDFLRELKARAEAATGLTFKRALSGRPVHFHNDPAKDTQAEIDLRACYLAAGFESVEFLPEPEAAAFACENLGNRDKLGLIVDIGGGTSDFTIFESTPEGLKLLGSHGIRLGGTDFDQAISLDHAMPLLGLGASLKRDMGAGLLPVPRAPFVDLATWAKIPFLYTPETRRLAADLEKHAVEPEKLSRFAQVLEMEMGHELAFAVEKGKIGANSGNGQGRIAMDFIEKGLSSQIRREDLDVSLTSNRSALRDAALMTLAKTGHAPEDIGRVVLVGGSSLMNFLSEEMTAIFPAASILRSEAFTAVVDGLALASRARN